MKKLCCIDRVNNSSEGSSCPMILRSACSHRHSHGSLIISDVQKQESTQSKRKSIRKTSSEKVSISDNSKHSSQFESSFQTSLKELALKSTETFSILKENLYKQLDLSEKRACEFVQQNGENFECIKRLNFSEISTPVSSLYLNAHLESTKLTENEYSIERDHNYNTTIMSRSRRPEKSSVRTLSGSETEEDSSLFGNRMKLRRKRTSDTLSRSSASAEISSQSNTNINNSSNHVNSSTRFSTSGDFKTSSAIITSTNNSYVSTPTGFSVLNQRDFSPNSPLINISAVQCSTLDRIRWLLWRYIYLKIISSVNFDVWLLSRLRERPRAVLFLLLPLLVYLLYSLLGMETEVLTRSFDALSSSVVTLFSSIYNLLGYSLKMSVDSVSESAPESPTCSGVSAFFLTIPHFFSNLFVAEKSTSFSSQITSHSNDPKSSPSEDLLARKQFESSAMQALDAKFNELAKKIEISHSQNVKTETVNILQKEISDLHVQFRSLSGLIQRLEKDVLKMDKSASQEDIKSLSNEHALVFNSLNTKLKVFEQKFESLNALKKCCDQQWTPADFTTSIEKHLVTAFRNVIAGEKSSDSPYFFFHQWLNSKFIDPAKLSGEINAAFEKMKTQHSSEVKLDQSSMNIVKNVVEHYVESLKVNLTSLGSMKETYEDSLSYSDMRKIVKEALMLYDADKTGKVDYALESGGGSILSTRCSESYVEKNGKFTILGVPLWSDENSPRTAIQPDVQPGKCWAFKGSQGYLVIQLSYTILPTGFTLEHIPVSLSPTGSIDSAPKEFSVWGLVSEKDYEGTLLGQYSFELNGEPLQYFPVQNFTTHPISFVELKILSNHGNLEYTCLYRFRVHGTRV